MRQAIASLAALPDLRQPLAAQLAAKERALAALQGGAAPVSRSHQQTISGNAQVGTMIAGDVHGPVSTTNQSGGINLGSGNTIGRVGDLVQGAKYVTHGPQISGPITSGRDTNIATAQTITNAAPSIDPPSAAAPLVAAQPPELRLWLEDTNRAPLSALTIDSEAQLRLAPASGAALPDLDLQLHADGAGVAWPEGTQRTLTVRDGTARCPVRWPLIPTESGVVTVRVLILAYGTLIQQLALTVACHPVGETVLTAAARPLPPPALTVPVGLTLSSVPRLPTHANALTLIIDREREGYSLRLIDGGSVTACPLALTDAGVADLLAYARTELLGLVGTVADRTLIFQQHDLTIARPPAEHSLALLARLGASLWQSLFAGPGAGGDALRLGERLRARSQSGPLHLTINAAHLPFPWPLLYDRDPNQPITPEGFWGFRHVLATVPTSGRSGPKTGDYLLGPAEALRVLLGLNLLIDQRTPFATRPVLPAQRQTIAALGLATDEFHSEAALRAQLAAGSDAELIYLFCHMLSTLPGTQAARPGAATPGVGSSRIVLTTPDQALTLRDMQQAAPLGSTPLLRSGPLVVLNACGSAELSPLTYDGLVPYLLDLGARTVIGTECDTPIYFGAAFGTALLRALVHDRLSAGEALRATRRQFLEQYQNPLGLLYALYGSADLQVAGTNGA